MPPAEETKKQSLIADVSHSESKLEDEPTDDESQDDTASPEFKEDKQSSGPVGQPRPKPAYLSSKPKENCHLRGLVPEPKIKPSHVGRSVLCNITMVSAQPDSLFAYLLLLCLSSYYYFVPSLPGISSRLVSAWLMNNKRFSLPVIPIWNDSCCIPTAGNTKLNRVCTKLNHTYV